MFLRASSKAIGDEADLGDAVTGSGAKVGVEAGEELVAFTEAAHRLDDSLAPARGALRAVVGEAGMIEAAMTSAVFRGLNITADASGIPIDVEWRPFVESSASTLGTDTFASATNSSID